MRSLAPTPVTATGIAPPPPVGGVVAAPVAAAAVVIAGCALLTLRPRLLAAGPDPTAVLVVLFAGLMAVAVAWPVAGADRRRPAAHVVAAVALGVVAFAAGRVMGSGRSPGAFAVHVVALNSLAAVAEEAFFRRLAYALLSPSGVAAAVGGTALLFAVVHVTVYGWWVLPIDLAAGLVLGWQREATGSWLAPAATHVIANLLVVL